MEPTPRDKTLRMPWIIGLIALVAIGVSLFELERGRVGVEISDISIGTTPATLYEPARPNGPTNIIAHGFAGSRQLMRAYSLTLARSGYSVLAFDFQGHGRNPVPMSGDVDAIEGTTAQLVAETRRVIAAGRERAAFPGAVALLGHSMATDILVRAAEEERAAGSPVAAIVAISMFSGAITERHPAALLAISGEWEPGLRGVALEALRLLDPQAEEGETAIAPGVIRRAVVAPGVEHVGVLFSGTALREARDWINNAYDRVQTGPVVQPGLWILLLLGGTVVLFHPLTRVLQARDREPPAISGTRFWAAVLVPCLLVPFVAVQANISFLPVLVADYLALHLGMIGVIQLLILQAWRRADTRPSFPAVLLLVFWGILVFGTAMDRYAAGFFPTQERGPIILALALGTVPFMVADSLLTQGGRGRAWRRVVPRVAFFLSLGGAIALAPDRLLFLLFIFPVLVLFFVVHGSMGRWIGQRAGAGSAGVGLGLCLAWAIGVTFPLFSPG